MVLHYQPKMDLKTKTIAGFEALIRWDHPVRGILPPIEFLPFLNGSDSIVELDEWVLNDVFRQVGEWREEGLLTTVSLNITSQSILLPGFVNTVESICESNKNIPVSSIQFEILETSILEDMEFAKKQLDEIRVLGIKVALDDFGTGYSSLGYLRNLPTDYIKIDQSFISGIIDNSGDQAIVKGLVQLSKDFDMKVVAEGIEDAAVLDKISLLGCDIAQGYYLSKPMPSESVIDWLSKKSWRVEGL
jgi:EAL domain-containing protein (putative c-di-GMP-specific phosphodiesterase class I)